MEPNVIEEQSKPELKAIKITQPLWVGKISGIIHDFCEKVKPLGITYETLYAYFVRTVQFGGDKLEFWVVFEGEEPIAFAHWYVKDLPFRGVVTCDYVYSWNRMSEPVGLLVDALKDFGVRNRSPLFEGFATNDAIAKVIAKAAQKKKMAITRTGAIQLFGR